LNRILSDVSLIKSWIQYWSGDARHSPGLLVLSFEVASSVLTNLIVQRRRSLSFYSAQSMSDLEQQNLSLNSKRSEFQMTSEFLHSSFICY
jgi:hypothetical protein